MGHHHSQPGPVGIRLGIHVCVLRTSRGWSRSHLASITGEFGRPLTAELLGRMERGVRKIDVDDLHVLACAFRITPSALLRGVTR